MSLRQAGFTDRIRRIDYGMVSGISTKSGVDNSYEIISTGLAGIEGDYGYLFNMKGNVVGISMKNTKTTFSVLGISDFKINDTGII